MPSIKSIKFLKSRRVRSGKPARVPGTDHRYNYATDGFFPRVCQRLAIAIVCSKVISILLVVWQLLSWPLALGCFRRLWLCISLWTEPLELRHTMMPGAVLAAISWAISSGLFRLYVSNFNNFNQAYGAVGAVMFDAVALHERRGSLVGDQLECDCGRLCTHEQSLH